MRVVGPHLGRGALLIFNFQFRIIYGNENFIS